MLEYKAMRPRKETFYDEADIYNTIFNISYYAQWASFDLR
jgi:hypothetical protein